MSAASLSADGSAPRGRASKDLGGRSAAPTKSAPAAPIDPEDQPITARRLVAFFALVFGMFMAILDIQIVSSSLGEIRAGLSASIEEVSWVQTSYLIAEVVMIPLSGFLSRALSTRVLFALSAGGFTLASALCATATTLEEMIVYRAFQGFIGGGMIPTAFAASYAIFPSRARGPVMALVGLTVTLAPTIGPTVGGYLTELFSWHWLFLINIVPGIAATLIAWTLVDFDEPDHDLLKRLDVIGLGAMAVFLGCLEYVLEEGEGDGWFESETITLFTAVTIVGALVFFWRAFTVRTPIVDLGAYKDRNFAVGSLLTFVLGIGLYGLTYLYPLYLARVNGYSALQIGETVFVSGAAMFVAAPIVGNLTRRVDPRRIILFGLIGFAGSSLLLTPITADWAFEEMFWPQALRGFSLMMCMVPLNILALGTLPVSELKNASGLYNLTRNLGGALGLALINTVLSTREDLHYARLAESIRWGSGVAEERIAGLAASLTPSLGSDAEAAALTIIGQMAREQAAVMSFADIFLCLGVLFAAMTLMTPLLEKPKAGPAPDAH